MASIGDEVLGWKPTSHFRGGHGHITEVFSDKVVLVRWDDETETMEVIGRWDSNPWEEVVFVVFTAKVAAALKRHRETYV